MIAFIDNNYCYVYSNLQYQEFLGQTESLKGKHMETVLGRKVFNKIKNRIDVALGGELVNYETDYSDKGSDIKYVNVTHVPHMKGKISLGFFSLILDITDQKEEEVKQKIQENQSRQLRHLKSLMTLSGGVAHEFNNLLVPIVGFTKMVQKNLDPECADAGYLGRVLKTAYRAKDIVAQVQLFSKRKELGSENVQPEVILDQLLKKNIKSLPAAIELKIEFGCDILPIIANPHQLEHIIINLYENAIEAMLDGGILKIKLVNTENDHLTHMNLYKKDQACICLSFEDTGHGMNSETCAQIFNPFFTTRGKANHTGLGLSVVLNIVEQFGGYIDVSSKLGEGANFKIYLPASKLAITQG